MPQVKITLSKSPIKRNARQKATVQALGLRKLHHCITKEATPQVQGMINAVAHLLTIEKI
ncbi:MAG: 50S ribosomal protein L30 [Bacteroidia bacterium]|jgi:large subunit ribosomal protein L30|nr:50S ribosomal protein L30 [Bacteroidia bacterium]